ncbi:unnamed protein product [Chrysoparadoxa australica]
MLSPEAIYSQMKAKREEFGERVTGAAHKAEKILREVKGTFSSDMEKTLLKATRPDNNPAKRKHVELLLKATEHFPMYMGEGWEDGRVQRDGPYWMVLHKLWRRMAEKDWRTVAKALYVLHRMGRDMTDDSWRYLAATLASLRREFDPKTGTKYFRRRAVKDVSSNGLQYAEFLGNYADLVFLRVQTLSPGCSELTSLDETSSAAHLLRALEKTELLIKAAVLCKLDSKEELIDNDVTCDAAALALEDLKELWNYYQRVMLLLVSQVSSGCSQDELKRGKRHAAFALKAGAVVKAQSKRTERILNRYGYKSRCKVRRELTGEVLEELLSDISNRLQKLEVKGE